MLRMTITGDEPILGRVKVTRQGRDAILGLLICNNVNVGKTTAAREV